MEGGEFKIPNPPNWGEEGGGEETLKLLQWGANLAVTYSRLSSGVVQFQKREVEGVKMDKTSLQPFLL
jgi:hypothetical protein